MLKQTFRNKSSFQYSEKSSNQIYSGTGGKSSESHTGGKKPKKSPGLSGAHDQQVSFDSAVTGCSYSSEFPLWLCLITGPLKGQNALPSGLMLASPSPATSGH